MPYGICHEGLQSYTTELVKLGVGGGVCVMQLFICLKNTKKSYVVLKFSHLS